ncbi:inner membrane protein [Escherichia coli]|nr:inner membrane protein [Escherichia coli]
MTIQQWLFSFKGRIGRRDFWIWIGLWFAGMLVLFSLAGKNLLDIQTAAFCLVCLLWPTAAVTVKRLHDRGRSGAWAFLMIVAWMLLAGNWAILPGVWQWAGGAFCPDVDSGDDAYRSWCVCWHTRRNKYGKDTQDVKYKADNKSSN